VTKAEALKAALARGASVASSFAEKQELHAFGHFMVDFQLLCLGGVPRGRVVELYGPPDGGKSLLAYRMIANAQRAEKVRLCYLNDVECRITDRSGHQWLERQGVDTSELAVDHEASLNTIFRTWRELIRSGDYSCLVLDSLALAAPDSMERALTRERDRKEYGDARPVAADARVVTEFLKDNAGQAARNHCTLLIINQTRDLLSGTLGKAGETTPGGKCLKFTAALRLAVHPAGILEQPASGRAHQKASEGDLPVIGTVSDLTVVKSKFGPRGRKTGNDTRGPLEILHRAPDPVVDDQDVIYGAVEMGLAAQSGGARSSWYECRGVKAQGLAKLAAALREKGLYEEVLVETQAAYVRWGQGLEEVSDG